MHKKRALTVGVAIAALIVPTAAQAAPSDNSIQPGRTFFGQVTSGQHPNRLVTLKNGTGAAHRIGAIAISGSGGYVYTLPTNALTTTSPYPRCQVSLRLAAGARCVLDVRVHTVRVGWWRSVLRVAYQNGWNNSAQFEAHVVAAPATAARSTQPGSCSTIQTAGEACS